MKIFLILVAVALVIVFFLRRNPGGRGSSGASAPAAKATPVKGRTSPAQRAQTAPGGGEYRATSIRAGGDACSAARELDGKRFLLSEVPILPLSGCQAAQCNCKYEHHQDRREDTGDRRAPAGLGTELFVESGRAERRADLKGSGRRSED